MSAKAINRPPNRGQTTLYRSDDDGESWVKQPFPFTQASFGGFPYEGVTLHALHTLPTGGVAAFGTTTVSQNVVVIWSIGGLVYRSLDGITWEQAHFALGPLAEMADAAGRLVAAGTGTVLDSADGGGWNGYLLEDANVMLHGGGPLDLVTRERLRIEDVAVQDGTYVAHAVTYVPYDPAGLIDTSTVDRRFVLTSAAPFGPGRTWTAFEHAPYYGKLLPSPNGLLGFTFGVFRSPDAGETWAAIDPSVLVPFGTVARTGATLIAVGSSEAAWRSTTEGDSWTRVWEVSPGPNLRVLGTFGGTVFATDGSDVWASDTNGETWERRGLGATGVDLVQVGGRLVLAFGNTSLVYTSDDGGRTWEQRTVLAAGTGGAPGMAVVGGNRLILCARGADVANQGKFYASDDLGTTWAPLSVPGHRFGDEARDIVRTASGRVLAAIDEFEGFEPRVFYSDDDGMTWASHANLETTPGFDPISGDPVNKVVKVQDLLASPTGRVLLLGTRGEIATSDDDGITWTVRFNASEGIGETTQTGVQDLVRVGDRWVALATRGTANPRAHFSLTSDDDGTTWRLTPFAVRQTTTLLQHLAAGVDGRVIAAGTNAAVYTSDGPPPAPPLASTQRVREFDTLDVVVPRPPVPGAVELRYSAVEDTALAGDDYEPAGGVLSWTALETQDRTFPLITIDDGVTEADEQVRVQIIFETSAVRGTSEILVTIEDDDTVASAAGLILSGAADLYTTEAGGTASLRVALARPPAADVVVTVAGGDPSEGSLSTSTLTFAPSQWNRPQELIVSGLDDGDADRDVSYQLTLTVASADATYAAVAPVVVYVVNVDDEPPPVTTTTLPGSSTTSSTTTTPSSTSTTSTTVAPCSTARCRLEGVLGNEPCGVDAVPERIVRRIARAIDAIEAAPEQAAKRAARTLRRAGRQLTRACKTATRNARARQPKIAEVCASAICEVTGSVL